MVLRKFWDKFVNFIEDLMSCTFGSKKKEGSPETISTNDIGAICALFDMEGPLCRLLDLIPETIQKIFTFNFVDDDGLDLFEKLLKKAAKKTAQLIYEDLTGRINVEGLCSNPPPPEFEDVTYSDVFIFISELVPILNYWFLANEVLTGESTKLLDKIVRTWLRKEWFKHCECKPKEPLPDEVPSLVNPPVTSSCMNASDVAIINERINFYNDQNQASALEAEISNRGSTLEAQEETLNQTVALLISMGMFDVYIVTVGPDRIQQVNPPFLTGIEYATGWLYLEFQERRVDFLSNKGVHYSYFEQNKNSELTGYDSSVIKIHPRVIRAWLVEKCPPPPPPPEFEDDDDKFKPDDFCALFPDDPLCVSESECQIERVICAGATFI